MAEPPGRRPRSPTARRTAAPATRARAEDESPRTSRLAVVRVLVAGLLLIAALFVFVFPTRAWLDQQAEIDRARGQLELLESRSGELADAATRLRSDAEVERLARERFNMVRPGEQAWAIVPGPTTTTAPRAP